MFIPYFSKILVIWPDATVEELNLNNFDCIYIISKVLAKFYEKKEKETNLKKLKMQFSFHCKICDVQVKSID